MKDLFAVVVAALLSIAGAFFGPKVYAMLAGNSTATKLVDQLITGRSALALRHANMGVTRYGTGAYSAANVIKWRILPDEAVDASTNALGNPFGGIYQISGAGREFWWDADSIPLDGCIATLTTFPPGSGYSGAAVASSMSGVGAATLNSLPVSPNTAASVCQSGENAIRFIGN